MIGTDTIQLHPDGDAVLVVHDRVSDTRRGFVVSSAVLSIVSDYFKTLLRSGFKEGPEARRGDCPRILLGQDDADAMGTLLSILHYQDPTPYNALNPKELAAVALHCDKYGCTRALKPWITHWFGGLRGISGADELGSLLVAAYFFRASDHFENISGRAVRHATMDIGSVWANHDMVALLPQNVKGTLFV